MQNYEQGGAPYDDNISPANWDAYKFAHPYEWPGNGAPPSGPSSKWSTLTPAEILADVNALLSAAWEGDKVTPPKTLSPECLEGITTTLRQGKDAEWFPFAEPTMWIPYSTYLALRMHYPLLHKLQIHRAKSHKRRPKQFTKRLK